MAPLVLCAAEAQHLVRLGEDVVVGVGRGALRRRVAGCFRGRGVPGSKVNDDLLCTCITFSWERHKIIVHEIGKIPVQ